MKSFQAGRARGAEIKDGDGRASNSRREPGACGEEPRRPSNRELIKQSKKQLAQALALRQHQRDRSSQGCDDEIQAGLGVWRRLRKKGSKSGTKYPRASKASGVSAGTENLTYKAG
jgi:hypothetical protein